MKQIKEYIGAMRVQYFLAALALIFLTSRCATPQAIYFDVQVADTTSFNLSPAGENVTIVFAAPEDNPLHNYETISNAMASQYETDQAIDTECVGLYLIPKRELNLGSWQYLKQLGHTTNSTILIIVSDFEYEEPKMHIGNYHDHYKIFPFRADLSIFDLTAMRLIKQMSLDEKIKIKFNDLISLSQDYDKYTFESEEVNTAIGTSMAGHLSTRWQEKELMMVDYESDSNWTKAIELATNFKLDQAIKLWLPYTKGGINIEREGFAAYNIAVAFEMMGEKRMALDWLEYSLSRVPDFSYATELYKSLKK